MADSDNQNNTSFEKLRALAQFITIGSGALTGVLWILSAVGVGGNDNDNPLVAASNWFLIATMVGGVSMGILYLIKLLVVDKKS